MDYVTAFDLAVIGFLGQFAGRNIALDHLVRDVADSSLLKGGIFMGYFWWLWFRAQGDVAARRQRVLAAIAGALLAVALSRAAQHILIFHVRPLHAADPATLSDGSSFPSDHAALFFALALAAWYESRLLGVLAMLWAVFVVCLPRVYLGFHDPSDVIAGIALGAAVMAGAQALFHRTALPAFVLRWEASHRAAFYVIAFVATYELTVLFYDVRQLTSDSVRLFQAVIVAHA